MDGELKVLFELFHQCVVFFLPLLYFMPVYHSVCLPSVSERSDLYIPCCRNCLYLWSPFAPPALAPSRFSTPPNPVPSFSTSSDGLLNGCSRTTRELSVFPPLTSVRSLIDTLLCLPAQKANSGTHIVSNAVFLFPLE